MNLDSATPAQREAITTDAMDVVVLAGPGSGKTATTVARINRLVREGIKPSEVVAITFTNSAASELERRLNPPPSKQTRDLAEIVVGPEAAAAFGSRALELGFVGTLHSFALRMLKEVGTPFGYGDRVAVISPESAKDLLESKARTVGCKAPIKELLALKARGRPERGRKLALAETVVAAYLDDLKEDGVVDYDAILHEFLAVLTDDSERGLGAQNALRARFSALFVDEVQDSAPLDWAIYRAFPATAKFLVGDTDQAIYSFRGGRVAETIALARDSVTKLIKLEENFRSRDEVCDAANNLIERNRDRIDKRTRSVRGPGGSVVAHTPFRDAAEEIAGVAALIREIGSESIAVLARTNAIADGFRRTLPAKGVPIVEQERSDLPRDWPLARSFVELLAEPDNDALAFFYLIASQEKLGATPKEARDAAHAARRAAAAASKSINLATLGFGRVSKPSTAVEALGGQAISRESIALAVEKFRELPPGANMLDFALALGEVREVVREGDGDGVRVLTAHGAKGREFDVVFVVGFEDEAYPGPHAIKAGDEAIEEERRLAYVALTRAKDALHITCCLSRVTPWGEVVARKPSRFLAEIKNARSAEVAE